jgi:hypothetical protein
VPTPAPSAPEQMPPPQKIVVAVPPQPVTLQTVLRPPVLPQVMRPGTPMMAAISKTPPTSLAIPGAQPAVPRPVASPRVSGGIVGSRRPLVLSLPEVPLDLDEAPGAEQFERINDTQVRYRPMSQVNPTGAVVPATMAAATWSALQGLQERVGDIDAWLCGRLRWNIKELGTYLTSEQVDGVALALDAADRQEGLVIADMTGFGKGRILAAAARAIVLSGRNVVFLTEKANLFSDFWRDIRDIGSEKVFGRPFMLNDGAKMVDTSSEAGQVIVPPWKKSEVDRILRSGALPEGSRLMMATYSQFNRKGTRKVEFLERVSSGGHVMLDEAHNFVGDSTTSKTVGAAVAAAGGSTFSSATFARDVGNLAAYSSVFPWLSRITGLEEMTPAQRRALAEESVRLATASGRIIRREHDLTNMVLRISTETGVRAQTNRALADHMAPVLSRMAKLARRVDAILLERNEVNRQHLETMTSAEERKAAREVWLTANFGSRLSAVLQQFLVALNVDPCVEMCVDSLLSGNKPVVVIESTMESLMRELSRDAEADEVEPGAGQGDDAQGALDLAPTPAPVGDDADEIVTAGALPRPDARPPTFREALMVLADRLLRVSVRRGVAYEKEAVVLDEPGLAEARDEIMEMASTFPDLSLSPIDDLRDRVEAEGRRLHAQGRIPRPWAADEISARGMRVVDGRYVSMPSADRNQIVARFVNGSTHMLVLTQAASTGLSIHDSEKFADHARRHMIELSPPRNVLARIQMWGRVWRRGQLTEPEFSVLDTGLPFHSYDLAARNRKLRELSASVTGTSRATVSLDVPDPIDLVGNEVAHDLLQEQQSLAEAMGISLNVDKEEADRELYFVGKLFRRLPLLTTDRQERVCAAFYAAYEDRLRNGADVQAGRHLEGRWTPVKREMLDPGDGTDDPVTGRDVTVTTLRSYRHARPMQHADIMAMADVARASMSARNPMSAHVSKLQEMAPAILQAALPRKGYSSVRQALGTMGDNPVKNAQAKLADMDFLLKALVPGIAARLPGEDDEMADGIVVAVRMPPVERANIAREYEIHFVVPGDEQPRTMSLDALVRERRTGLSTREAAAKMQAAFDEAPRGDVAVERKVLDGGGIGAVLASRRVKSGTRITYTDEAGRSRSGILLSRAVARRIAGAPARTNIVEVAQHVLERGGKLQTNFASPADGVEIRPETGGGIRVVIPGSKRAAKGFETLDILELTGPFEGDFRERSAKVSPARASAVLELLVRKGHEFNFDGTMRAAAIERTREVVEERHGTPPPRVPSPHP